MDTFDNYGRNFDPLAPKFKRKVYGGLKGRIRSEIITRDLMESIPKAFLPARGTPLNILDAGCGSAPVSLKFAQQGHRVTLCDISQQMLTLARSEIKNRHLENEVSCLRLPIQQLPDQMTAAFDMVLCHAVLDWVADPEELAAHLLRMMRDTAILSLTFYNLHGMIFKNLLRASYKKIEAEQFSGWEGSLTPSHPKQPDDVIEMVKALGLKVIIHSGIRVFHDYILDPADQKKQPDTVIALEAKFSRLKPYRDLGRYQHLVCRKI